MKRQQKRPKPDCKRLERECKAYVAAVRQDFLSGYRAIIPLSAEERGRVLLGGP